VEVIAVVVRRAVALPLRSWPALLPIAVTNVPRAIVTILAATAIIVFIILRRRRQEGRGVVLECHKPHAHPVP
jgi:hypothetical protein